MSKSVKVIWGVLVGIALLYAGMNNLTKPTKKEKVGKEGTVIYKEGVKKVWNDSRWWVTLLSEDFESGTIPPEWTVIDGNGDGYMWTAGTTPDLSDPPPNYGTAYAWYSDDDAGSGAPPSDEQLWTPPVYVGPDYSQARVKFGWGIDSWDYDDSLKVFARKHDGSSWGSWTLLSTYTPDGNGEDTLDLTSFLPAESLQVQFQYVDHGGWNWAVGVDNIAIEVFEALNHDVGTAAIVSPTGIITIGDTVDVIVTFGNYGQNTETFPVHVEIIDPNSNIVFTGDSTLTLNPSQTIDVLFGQWTPTVEGAYTITAYTNLTGDEYPANDTLTDQFRVSVWSSSWTSYTPPPSNADRLTHATVYDPDNDKIYMIGGTPNGQPGSNVNLVYRYDPVTDSWETNLAPMPQARGWIQGAYWDGKIYIAGGYTNSQTAANTFYIYDIATNSWTTGPTLPEGRVAHGTVAWNGNIYVIGGVRPDLSSGSQTVYRYDIANGTWSNATQLPQQYDMGGVTILGDTIFIVSGYNRGGGTAWTDIYAGIIDPTNPDSITWVDLGPLPYPNILAAACGLRGKVFMIGGFENASTATYKAWEYDIATATWSQLPDYVVPIVRNHFAVARPSDGTVGERIYVVAGDANGDWGPPNNYYYYLEGEISVAEKPYSAKPILFSVTPTLTKGPLTVIFTLRNKSKVDISIYNTLGQKVATVFKGVKNSGTHTLSWNGKLRSGVYFIKISSPEHYPVKKIIRVK